MIKKLTMLAFVCASVWAGPAAAYEQVCVFGKDGIGYQAKFRLIWGVPPENKVWRQAELGFPWESDNANISGGFASGGATHWSSLFRLNTRKCVNLDQIPRDSRFVVQVRDYPAARPPFFCNGWENDRGKDRIGVFVNGREEEGKTLVVDAWGSIHTPRCMPSRVEE